MREKSEKVSNEPRDTLPCDLGSKFSGLLEGMRDNLESLLPCDPFGMDLGTTLGGWIEGMGDDLELNSITISTSDQVDGAKGEGEDQLFSDVVEGRPPHDGLFFALNYLGVNELFSVERVCKSLRDAVRYDPLLWRRVCVNYPMSLKIDDDALIQLTNRAQGALECLVLVECIRITDDGLRQVLERNPRLVKLSVPGCVRLSIEGMLSNMKTLRSMGKLGIKLLRISGLGGVTKEKFEELKSLLGAESPRHHSAHKPRFFGGESLYLSCEDSRNIDIEKCPLCDRYRQVYDCTLDRCSTTKSCRGCKFCIARCIDCGRCIRDFGYVETLMLDLSCLDCWRQRRNHCNQAQRCKQMRSGSKM